MLTVVKEKNKPRKSSELIEFELTKSTGFCCAAPKDDLVYSDIEEA